MNKNNLKKAKFVTITSFVFLTIICSILTYKEGIYQRNKVKVSKQNAETIIDLLSSYIDLNFSYIELLIDDILTKDDNISDYINENINKIKTKTVNSAALIYIDKHQSIEIFNLFDHNEVKIDNNVKSDIYLKHKSNITNYMEISRSNFQGQSYVILSKRINNKHNNFAGIIGILIKANYLNHFFNSISSEKKIEMAILENKDEILFESKDVLKDIDVIKSIKDDKENFYIDTKETVSIYKDINGNLNIFAFKHLYKWPITVALVSSNSEIIKSFLLNSENLNIVLILAVIILILLSFCASIITKYFEKTQEFEKILIIAEKSKLDTAIKIFNQTKISLEAVSAFIHMFYSEYLGKLNNNQHNKLIKIKDWTNHILDLVKDTSESLNNPNSATKIKISQVEINLIFDKSLSMLDELISFKNISIEVIDNKISKKNLVFLDRLKFIQIFINILEFIIEYSEKSAILKYDFDIDEADNLKLSLSSNGFILDEKETAIIIKNKQNYNKTDENISLAQFFIDLHKGKIDYSFKEKIFLIIIEIPNQKLENDNNKKIQ